MTDPTAKSDVGGELSLFEKLKRRKLKNYLFLDKKLQFNFAALLMLIWIINSIYFCTILYLHTAELIKRLAPFIPEWAFTEELFVQENMNFYITVAFVLIGELFFILLLGLFFSHRIAGPLYAMTLRMKDIASGVIPRPVKLRKDDLLTNFADRMNEALLTLSKHRSETEAALAEAKSGNVNACIERLSKITAPAESAVSSSTDDEPL